MTQKRFNPKSLENLNFRRGIKPPGRKTDYDQPKVRRGLAVTEAGWNGVKAIAQHFGLSLSEFIDRLGRKELLVCDPEKFEERLGLHITQEALAEGLKHSQSELCDAYPDLDSYIRALPNRSEWLRQAVKEKIERDKQQP